MIIKFISQIHYLRYFILLIFMYNGVGIAQSTNFNKDTSNIEIIKKKVNSKSNNQAKYINKRQVEDIANNIYDERHKLEPIMSWTNFVATIIMAILSLFALLFSGRIFIRTDAENKQEIIKFKKKLDREISKFSEKAEKTLKESLVNFKNNIDNKLNETEASFYYHFAIKFFNKEYYEVAIEFFEPLYKSKEYRYSEVCRYLSECFFRTRNYERVTLYLKEALQSTEDNIYAYGIISFLKEALKKDELKKDICDFLNNEHSNPRGYYQANTKELIKRLIDENCKDIQE